MTDFETAKKSMKHFKSTKWLGVVLALLVPAFATAALELPNTFKAGDPISAAAMNANFEAVKAKLEESEALLDAQAVRLDALEARLEQHVKSPSWTAPTLLNGWVDYGGGFATSGYRKDDHGVVHLKGLVKDGAETSPIFILPAGFRPVQDANFVGINTTTAFANVRVYASGEVFMPKGTVGFVSLDGYSFVAK